MRVKIRPMRIEDKNFIYASWLNNYKKCSDFAKRITNSVFFERHHAVIDHILSKPESRVMIAHSNEDDDNILGFVAFEDTPTGQVVHYTFVKSKFQGLGIAKQLFKESGIDFDSIKFTHFTYAVNEILRTREGPEYDPYRI